MNEEVYDRFGEGVILEKGPWKVRLSLGGPISGRRTKESATRVPGVADSRAKQESII